MATDAERAGKQTILDSNASSGPPPARRRRSSRNRRAEVLEVATRFFFEKGYEATSVQDLADELGLLKGSLYYYMASKEELLFEILDNYHGETKTYFARIQEMEAPVLEKLRAFIEIETRHAATHYRESALFYSEWRSLTPEHREPLLAERHRHEQFVEDCIRGAQEAGEVDAEVDRKLMTNAILGMANSVYRWYRPGGPRSAEEIGQAFGSLVLDGLVSRGAL